MADTIAVMNRGQIEQSAPRRSSTRRPRPRSSRASSGVSNLLRARVEGSDASGSTAAPSQRAAARAPGRTARSRSASGPRRSGVGGDEGTRSRDDRRERLHRRLDPVHRRHAGGRRHRLRPERPAGRERSSRPESSSQSAGARIAPSSSTCQRRAEVRDLLTRDRAVPTQPPPARNRLSSRPRRSVRRRREQRRHDDSRRRRHRPSSPTRSGSRTGSCTSTRTRRRSDPVPRGVRGEGRHQGQVRRGHQRQRTLLREDPGAAVAGARGSTATSS